MKFDVKKVWQDFVITPLDNYFSANENERIVLMTKELKRYKEQEKAFINQLEMLSAGLTVLEEENQKCRAENKELTEKYTEVPLEKKWNTMRPQKNVVYAARPLPTKDQNIEVDVRIFLDRYDSRIPTVSGASNDEKAKAALYYVIKQISYTPDMTQFKFNEMWLFAWETMKMKKGDCEDGAILLANILLKSGVPYWRVRLNAGSVQGGGHAWVTYLRESDNEWVILDWCYWPDVKTRNLEKTWKEAEEKYFSIWFSWNEQYAFKDDNLDR